ncbi:MAG: response regulator transcription factor [Bacilli bacterium]|nr:response regulator transcription factor [Bacilli bacterium]
MKFVLVEDDLSSIEKVKSIISKVVFSYNISYDVIVYNNCSSMLKKEIMDISVPKIYILSVDLKQNISGIDIAEYIREIDWNSHIIFLTKHGNMFETVHRKVCNVFEFIEKYQQMDKRLSKDIKKIIEHSFDNECLNYTYHFSEFKINYKCIKYIQRDTATRKIIIHTSDKTYESNMTIKELLCRLDNRFKQVSKSTVINEDFITELCWNKGYAILKDDTIINSISKKYKVDV